MRSDQQQYPEVKDEDLIKLFSSIEHSEYKPQFIFFTGGEPLLRPKLLVRLSKEAKKWNGKNVLITGGFFSSKKFISKNILNAIKSMDLIIFSWDSFHEEYISFSEFRNSLAMINSMGITTAIQFTYTSMEKDNEQLSIINDEFPNIEIFFNRIQPVGRALDSDLGNFSSRNSFFTSSDTPCISASWPVISYQGNIIACCNQNLVDSASSIPTHLFLGQVESTSWDDIVNSRVNNPILNVIETLGPEALTHNKNSCSHQCNNCIKLGSLDNIETPHLSPQMIKSVKNIRKNYIESHLQGYI
jgi:organic radical activating enzyme